MSFKIVVDSACDVVDNDRDDLTVIPIKIRFDDGNEYLDGISISHREFYERLIESEALPTTSQINPYDFSEYFEEIIKTGNDVLCITLSSKLSGSYQSACIAADDFDGKVIVVDSLNATVGQRVLVDYALRLKDEGKPIQEVADILNKEKKNIQLVALLDTLEYLKKGGRISATAAVAGGILSIKPVVGVIDGAVEVLGKARGSKNAENALFTKIYECGGVDFSMPYRVGYTGISDDVIKKYIKDSSELWDKYVDEIKYQTVGSAIGTHVGPGGIACAFFPKHPERLT